MAGVLLAMVIECHASDSDVQFYDIFKNVVYKCLFTSVIACEKQSDGENKNLISL